MRGSVGVGASASESVGAQAQEAVRFEPGKAIGVRIHWSGSGLYRGKNPPAVNVRSTTTRECRSGLWLGQHQNLRPPWRRRRRLRRRSCRSPAAATYSSPAPYPMWTTSRTSGTSSDVSVPPSLPSAPPPHCPNDPLALRRAVRLTGV